MSSDLTPDSQPAIAKRLQVLQSRVIDVIAFYQQDLDFSTMVYTHWSAKDILGHLVFWHESFARNLRDVAENRKPNPLSGRLSEVNQRGVDATRSVSIDKLIERLTAAQQVIEKHIFNPEVQLIPYKKGSRDYGRQEHLEIVAAHLKRHLKDLHKKFRLNNAKT